MCLCEVNGLCSVFYFHRGLRSVSNETSRSLRVPQVLPHGALEVLRDTSDALSLPCPKPCGAWQGYWWPKVLLGVLRTRRRPMFGLGLKRGATTAQEEVVSLTGTAWHEW